MCSVIIVYDESPLMIGLSAILDQRSSPGFCTSYRAYIW